MSKILYVIGVVVCALGVLILLPGGRLLVETGDFLRLVGAPIILNGLTLFLYGVALIAIGRMLSAMTTARPNVVERTVSPSSEPQQDVVRELEKINGSIDKMTWSIIFELRKLDNRAGSRSEPARKSDEPAQSAATHLPVTPEVKVVYGPPQGEKPHWAREHMSSRYDGPLRSK